MNVLKMTKPSGTNEYETHLNTLLTPFKTVFILKNISNIVCLKKSSVFLFTVP